ncbi:modular serine protease-like [Osmia lignaria lignaria]|uniref:modular serine protease-like n=1 Tax=Osmia lignaria lignaria TaxID=1437193 RepID=UPI00402B9301
MKNKITIIVIITYSLIECGYTQRSRCGLEKFQCNNGQCIASELVCDGRADCKDKSDETYAECNKPEIICPGYAFRCSYGACVDGDATCNGIKDCVDNSDETLFKCTSASYNASTSCTKDQFKCNNGQCISESSLCDGNADCVDNSDETFIQCGSITCSELFFRCSYGACIDSNLKCNGVTNCVDGSDEDPKLCGGTTTTVRPAPPIFTFPTESSSDVSPPWIPATCTVPAQPKNGYRKLYKPHCCDSIGSSQSCDLCDVSQGTKIKPGEYLVYSCKPGYELKGRDQIFCTRDGQLLNIPVCTEIRCEGLESNSRSAKCQYQGQYVSCQSSVSPYTEARLKCRGSYRRDTTLLSTAEVTRCNKTGQWEPRPIQCVPECGVSPIDLVPLIVNGTRPNITEFPWHATLYRDKSLKEPKEFICGATIIHEKFLVTAAHCVYDDIDPSKYYIATGNIYRDYDFQFHDPIIVKKAKVKNIYVTCNYRGLEGNYAEDIAVLEIETPFKFSSILVPICLDIARDLVGLEVGDVGKVAGFGKTASGASSFVLQSITVPYVSATKCRSSSDYHQTKKYITFDKFCAGYTNGSSVCDGDSGGGFVVKKNGVWYLAGIVSVSLGTRILGGSSTCDSYSYTLYTTVSEHVQWIQDVLHKLQDQQC